MSKRALLQHQHRDHRLHEAVLADQIELQAEGRQEEPEHQRARVPQEDRRRRKVVEQELAACSSDRERERRHQVIAPRRRDREESEGGLPCSRQP